MDGVDGVRQHIREVLRCRLLRWPGPSTTRAVSAASAREHVGSGAS